MKSTLELFTKKPLPEAAGALLTKLGLEHEPMLLHESVDSFFDISNFSYEYINEVRRSIKHIWEIGAISNAAIQKHATEVSDGYDLMLVYACEIKEDAAFSRSDAVSLTRAFNRVCSKTGFFQTDIPTIVIMLQGGLLSIASCERSNRLDNNGEKIGKVTMLRNIDCGNLRPPHRQILERIAGDVAGASSFEELYSKWMKSFSIDVISDRFFKEYKSIYEDIVEFSTGKRMVKVGNKWQEHDNHHPCKAIMEEFSNFSDPDKAVRDFVKKLMGRIVFIHFLQKKGWMGVPAGESWEGGDPDFLENLFNQSHLQETFIDDVLKPLFLDINTNRSKNGDLVTNPEVEGGCVKVPYLNGGLFEEDEYDRVRFPLDASLVKKMIDFFSRYNFTIDENAPDNVEIGVDPEMLGRIFENLLEDNKDKGAFYTPKGIVEEMCRDALIAYLQTGVDDEATKQAYKDFVLSHDISVLKPEDVYGVDKKLREVKICDPAIGSGAFPMGMLKELFDCRMSIEQKAEKRLPSEIKKDIIQNSIYGVDIEKGAVDIARLRFWLSLIIDEATPHVLPNMDFKIVQGNSLLEEFEGVNLSGLSINDQSVKKAKKGDGLQLAFVLDEQGALDNIQKAIHEYYNTDNHALKEQLRTVINDNVISYIYNLKNCTPEIHEKLKNLSIPNDRFFLWHIYFKEVFDKGGFDIVLGNPPYFVYEGRNKGELRTLRGIDDYSIALGGKLNAYKLFLAHALRCLVKPSGITCFIFQNSFMADQQAANLRDYTLSHCQILSIDSFPERDSKKKRVFESVKMSVCIVVIKNEQTEKPFVVNIWDDKNKTSGTCTSFTRSEIEVIDNRYHSIPRITEKMKPIVIKMQSKRASNISLPCFEGELNVSSDRQYFSTDASLPVIMKGAGIQRYYYTYQMSQGEIEYLKEKEYLRDMGDADRALHHLSDRIVMQGMTGANDAIRLVMTIIPKGIYLGHSCKYIMPIKELPLECVLGIMNSRLANAFFRCFSTNSNVNCYEISSIPIPAIPEAQVKTIKNKVSSILSKKAENSLVNTDDLEREIDRIVYELYGLTNAEVKLVSPLEVVSGSDCELFKA